MRCPPWMIAALLLATPIAAAAPALASDAPAPGPLALAAGASHPAPPGASTDAPPVPDPQAWFGEQFMLFLKQCAPVVGCDIPYLVDEHGDIMTGQLEMQSNILLTNNSKIIAQSGSFFDTPPDVALDLKVNQTPGISIVPLPPEEGPEHDLGTGGVVVKMFGDVDLGEHGLVINGGALRSPTAGILEFEGQQLCTVPAPCGGTVSLVATGAGLTGGPITGSGTISVAAEGITNAMLAAGSVSSDKVLDGTLAIADLAFDPATQAELDAFAASLAAPGTINAAANPLEWSRLKSVPAGFADGVDDDTTYTAGTGLALSGTTFQADFTAVQARVAGICPDDFAMNAINVAGAVTCLPFWGVGGNAGIVNGYLGTLDPQALNIGVGSERALRIEPAVSPNLIGGHAANAVATGALGASIAGGGDPLNANRVHDDFGAVGGGLGNAAGSDDANTGNAAAATVAGGAFNTAKGFGAMVPGGRENVAAGATSLAAGHRARALHHGAFVWADASSPPFDSLAANEFSVRATGGARFVTAVSGGGAPIAGVELSPGASAWSTLSDQNSKENFQAVDGRAVLGALAQVPITSWNWKAQSPSIRHMGPMAQDFHAAFGLGESPTRINTVDVDGVALAAIQGLHAMVLEQQARIAALEQALEDFGEHHHDDDDDKDDAHRNPRSK